MIKFENIPSEMTTQKRWLGWKYEEREGSPRPQKTPFLLFAPEKKASTINEKHWSTYAQAKRQYNEGYFTGIGFVLGNGIVLIDLDNCIVDGKTTALANEIVTLLDSYVEVSPSGKGAHIFIHTTMNIGNRVNKAIGIEIYSKDRYSTVTGQCRNPKPICNRDSQLRELLEKYFPEEEKAHRTKKASNTESVIGSYEKITHISNSDWQLWNKMFTCKQGEKYRKLFNNTYTSPTDDQSQSYADKQLLNGLAFWCGYDRERIKKMALQSALYREKWNENCNGMPLLDFQIEESILFCRKSSRNHEREVITM